MTVGALMAMTVPGVAVAAQPSPRPAVDLPGIARVHLGTGDVQADGEVFGQPSISADGSKVAFASDADNLVPGDTNDAYDVFVRDRKSGTTTRVSVSSAGRQALAPSNTPVISADGRYVAFTSYAPNLTPGDLNAVNGSGVTGSGADVFLHDLSEHTTVRVSRPLIGWADGESDFAAISADGRFVAFDSTADNLVPGDTNGVGDVFVWDRYTSTVRRVSESASGVQGDGGSGLPAISADGSTVAFISNATNLVRGDTAGYRDAFVADLDSRELRRVGLTTAGGEPAGDAESVALSGDASTAAVVTTAALSRADKNFVADVYASAVRTGTSQLVSWGSGGRDLSQPPPSYDPALSHDGRFIAYTSGEADPSRVEVSPWGTQIWLRDLRGGAPRMVSRPPNGTADDSSRDASISADGTHVSFASDAQNLVPFDDNHSSDAFVVDLS